MAASAEPDHEVTALDACTEHCVNPEKVAEARSRLISGEEAGRLSDLFRLLGDPTRTRMLYALLEAGELCVCDLSATVGIPENSASHALRLLRSAGVVRKRRSGRMIYYSIDDAHVRLLLDLSREHLKHS
ncbi:MAG: metalloregulator ArsR/SmtB family transcription factor [Actinomycetota bacterium]